MSEAGGGADRPRRVVLHIGGSKTASTSLQKGLFLHAPHTHHFGEYGDGVTSIDEEAIVLSMLGVDDAFYDEEATRALFARHEDAAADGTLVFSSADVLHANQPHLAARRLLALVGPDADVLLVIRSQQSALASYYAGHGAWLKPAPRPYFRAFVSFDDWLAYQWLLLPDSRLRTFAYWEQVTAFVEAFGRERIHVVCFENLVRGDIDAWHEVGALVGLDGEGALALFQAEHQRERITERQLQYGRAMRLLLPFVSTPDVRHLHGPAGSALQGGSKFVPEWPASQLTRLAAFYSAGNSSLAADFGVPLGALKYPGVA